MNQKALYRKAQNKHLGPGGFFCACCGPSPGKQRKKFKKQGRKLFSKLIDKDNQDTDIT